MGKQITVRAEQQSLTTTKATVRSHSVLIDRPESKDGTDLGAMGGELLLMSLGGCFMSNLLEIVRTRDAKITNINIEITGTLSDEPPARYVDIAMVISAQHDDKEQLEKFVVMSERACIVANSLKQGIPLSISVA